MSGGRRLEGVWEHFERKPHLKGWQAMCKFCNEAKQHKLVGMLRHLASARNCTLAPNNVRGWGVAELQDRTSSTQLLPHQRSPPKKTLLRHLRRALPSARVQKSKIKISSSHPPLGTASPTPRKYRSRCYAVKEPCERWKSAPGRYTQRFGGGQQEF